MTERSNKFMIYAGLAGALIAGVLAIVMFVLGQPIPGSGLAVIAICALGTVPVASRRGGQSQ